MDRSPTINTFISYYRRQWVIEGYAPGLPSQNNALEGTNGVIKNESSFRERFPLGQFLHFAEKLVSEWSEKRDPINLHIDSKVWKDTPTLALNDWTAAHQWLLKKKDKIKLQVAGKTMYFTPSGQTAALTKNQVKDHL